MNNPSVEQVVATSVSFETSPDQVQALEAVVRRRGRDAGDGRRGRRRPAPHDYRLKLNTYDLGVDIELADAVQRLRFEHPEVRAVVVTSLKDRIFCAGANIFMLGGSTPRVQGELLQVHQRDAPRHGGRERALAASSSSRALNGIGAGGGYELALACDEILLVDDGNSAVSLPEVPLLGVLPGTGGLTRVVDKRKVRRDLADVFCTLAEGVKGKRAVEWGLVDAVLPDQPASRRRSRSARASWRRSRIGHPSGPGIALRPLDAGGRRRPRSRYRYVSVRFDARSSASPTLTVRGAGRRHSRPRRRRFAGAGDELLAARAPSASSTMRCCGCASTNRRSAPWSFRTERRSRAGARGRRVLAAHGDALVRARDRAAS